MTQSCNPTKPSPPSPTTKMAPSKPSPRRASDKSKPTLQKHKVVKPSTSTIQRGSMNPKLQKLLKSPAFTPRGIVATRLTKEQVEERKKVKQQAEAKKLAKEEAARKKAKEEAEEKERQRAELQRWMDDPMGDGF